MDDLLSGLVVNVTSIPVGTQTAAAAAIGDTVLLVDDAGDLSPTGGQVTIDGTVTDYLESDDDESTITLTTPRAAALAEGADVAPYPPRVEVTALVLVDGASDPIPATVPWNLQDALKVGVREEEDREQVTLQRDGQWSWSVYNLDGQILSRDAVFGHKPGAGGIKGSDQDLPNNEWTLIAGWAPIGRDRVDIDLNSRFVVGVDGEFHVGIGASFASNSTGRRGVRMHYWGVLGEDLGVSRPIIVAADGGTTIETNQDRRMTAGQSVSFEAYQNSGGVLSVRGSNVFSGSPPLTDCKVRWEQPL